MPPKRALADLELVLRSGKSCKEIALERGITASGLSCNVRNALDHLGLADVPLRVARVRLGARRSVPDGATARQREVLELQADGLLYAEIAERLGVALSTVRNHAARARRRR